MKFTTKNSSISTLHSGLQEKCVEETEYKVSWFTD